MGLSSQHGWYRGDVLLQWPLHRLDANERRVNNSLLICRRLVEVTNTWGGLSVSFKSVVQLRTHR